LDKVGILIFENDAASQSALRQVLDSEGWQVRIVPDVNRALAELSTGAWSLVIASTAMATTASPAFSVLKELAHAPAVEEGKFRARVLFLVPETGALDVQPLLEREHLPYVLKPFPFHDLLEKVSDLLMETSSLANPIRRVRHDATLAERTRDEMRAGHQSGRRTQSRQTSMFANRGEYVMTEEEIAEYERTEQRELAQKRKKKLNSDRF
jgi:DNA-binding response OmpR family regulator